jgi:hypothetical protein
MPSGNGQAWKLGVGDRQLRHDLGGRFDVGFTEAGLRHRLELPLKVPLEQVKVSKGPR